MEGPPRPVPGGAFGEPHRRRFFTGPGGGLPAPGGIELTRTHGRREVAFLNRAWEDVLELDLCLDTSRQAQPLLDHAVNTRPSRCAGFEGLGTGLERMAAVLCDWEAEI